MKKCRTILIADDDADDIDLLCSVLLECDNELHIITAGNGAEAINLLRAYIDNPPAVMILDYEMPVLNGLQTLQRTSCNGEFPPVATVLWSNNSSKRLVQKSQAYGALLCLEKPITYRYAQSLAATILSLCLPKK